MISKTEMVDFIKKRFEAGLNFEKLELKIEDKDVLAWQDILLEHGEKNGNQPMYSYGKTTKFRGISSAYAILKKKSPS